MTGLPSRDDLAGQIESLFTLDRNIRLKLIKVTETVSRPPQEQFTAVFLAPPDSGLEQRIYEMEHPVLGRMDLFLVPVALNENGLEMQAVFNYLVDQ